MSIIITCEHAGNQIPGEYGYLFGSDSIAIVASHRGWDPGAWQVAQFISGQLQLPLYGCHTTRLLIETNRSRDHEALFSEFSRSLSTDQKGKLLTEVYDHYRNPIEQFIRSSAAPVLHLSIHSFTPVLHGKVRVLDVGLLFDPDRSSEQVYSNLLKTQLREGLPDARIEFNRPYQGIDDGFTTYLRSSLEAERYSGIEIELNQKLLGSPYWNQVKVALVRAIKSIQDVS
jgi:predicted N-formylglutamate amidohydrolase